MVGLAKINYKICSKCKIEKDLDDFYKNKITKDGYQNTCKQCQNEYNKTMANTFKTTNPKTLPN